MAAPRCNIYAKRQHEQPRIVCDLLQSEIAEKLARSIRYQLTVAKLPLAKDIEDVRLHRHADQRESGARPHYQPESHGDPGLVAETSFGALRAES